MSICISITYKFFNSHIFIRAEAKIEGIEDDEFHNLGIGHQEQGWSGANSPSPCEIANEFGIGEMWKDGMATERCNEFVFTRG